MNADKERYDRLLAKHRDPARLTEEIIAYWQQQAAEARTLNEIYVAELMAKSSKLETSERCLREAESRITMIDMYERTAYKTGYRTPYILAAVTEEVIREEIANAQAYTGPALNDYPSVIGVIGYDVKRQQWTFAPDKNAMIYSGDTVIGQVLGDNGHQVTPTLKGRGRKKRRS